MNLYRLQIMFIFFVIIKTNYIYNKNNIKDEFVVQKTKTLLNVNTVSVPQKNVIKIDTNKIYAPKEVTSCAMCLMNNNEYLKFWQENFRHKGMPLVNGRVFVDLIIERDGSVSDVIIIKGLHPVLDKEVKRVMKLLPKIVPAKYKGIPVRSKLRKTVLSRAM